MYVLANRICPLYLPYFIPLGQLVLDTKQWLMMESYICHILCNSLLGALCSVVLAGPHMSPI